MSDVGDQTSDQGRFAAREFLAQFTREMGGDPLRPMVVERMLFAYEMGYLRGRSDGALEAMKMFGESSPKEGQR